MIIFKPTKGILYPRCSSIETHQFDKSVIIVTVDSFNIREAIFTKEEERRAATIVAILNIYLKDDVIIDETLCNIFENELQLMNDTIVNYNGVHVMYSNIIVKGLIENGFKEGLREDAINFFS